MRFLFLAPMVERGVQALAALHGVLVEELAGAIRVAAGERVDDVGVLAGRDGKDCRAAREGFAPVEVQGVHRGACTWRRARCFR
jgi:hypothetical protein